MGIVVRIVLGSQAGIVRKNGFSVDGDRCGRAVEGRQGGEIQGAAGYGRQRAQAAESNVELRRSAPTSGKSVACEGEGAIRHDRKRGEGRDRAGRGERESAEVVALSPTHVRKGRGYEKIRWRRGRKRRNFGERRWKKL